MGILPMRQRGNSAIRKGYNEVLGAFVLKRNNSKTIIKKFF